jgi:hypothetical protein
VSRHTRLRALGTLAVALALTAAPARAELAFGPAVDVETGVEVLELAPLRPAGGAFAASVAVMARVPAPMVLAVGLDREGRAAASSAGWLAAASQPNAMAAADLDADGADELLVASAGTDAVSVLRVPEGLAGVMAVADHAAGPNPRALAAADFTGDGKPDAAVATDTGIAVMAGDGAGGLGLPLVVVPLTSLANLEAGLNGAAQHVADLENADLDGDGRPDLIAYVVHDSSVSVRTLLGDGTGGFAVAPATSAVSDDGAAFIGKTVGTHRLDSGDMDGDGDVDVAFTGYSIVVVPPTGRVFALVPDVRVLAGGAGGTLASASLPPGTLRPPPPLFGTLAGLADIDGDGRGDVLAAGNPLLVERDPLRSDVVEPLPTAGRALLAIAPDLNMDGAPDLVLAPGSAPATLAVALARPVPAGTGRDFGEREVGGAGAVLPLEVENRGVAPLSIATLTLSGAAAGDFATVDDACAGRTLLGGQRCTAGLRFRPTAVGRREAEVVVSAAGGEALRLQVSGVGVAPAVVPAPQPTPPRNPASVRAGCLTRPTGGRMRLGCGLVLGSGAMPSRVAMRLVRGGRVRALADVRAGGRVILRARRPLAPGRYTLVVVVVADSGSQQTRRQVALRA